MTGPRQTRRIVAKTKRLEARDGRGVRGTNRKKAKEPFGRWWSWKCGKFAYRTEAGALAAMPNVAELSTKPGRLNVYRHGDHWHVGHHA
jgi:hypothetical protein